MTTELTQPQSEVGSVPANGQGQSQGHRRRRRRRKNKTTGAGAPPAQQPLAQVQPQAPPQAPPPQLQQPAPPRSAPAHANGHQGGGRQNQNQPRKKKFFQKGSSTAPQPGNSIAARDGRRVRASLWVPWTTATVSSMGT